MSIQTKNQQQIEFEVFPKEDKLNYSYLSNVRHESPSEPTPINVVFSYQSVVVIFICALMLLVASFALGVEKGKLIAKNSILTEKEATSSVITPSKPTTLAETSMPLSTPKLLGNTPEKLNSAVPAQIPVSQVPQKETTPLASGGYVIQVASLKSESAAKILSELLIKKGIASYTKSSGKYIMVLAGNFAKREEAQVSLKELKKTYADCFIKKI